MDFYIYCLFVACVVLFVFSGVNYLIFPDNRMHTIWEKIIYYIIFVTLVLLIEVSTGLELYYLLRGNTVGLVLSSVIFLISSIINFIFSDFDATVMNISFSQKMLRMIIETFTVMFIVILILK